MVDEHGFPKGRCHNAGYGVDTSFFQPKAPPPSPFVVSAGSANRDYQTLVSAVDGLDVPVRIAADSLWRPKGSDVDIAELPPQVSVASAGDYMQLRNLYAAASIVVVPLHPARFASGYAVIAEAMAMGKVVVTTRTDALSDLIVDGQTGVYVDAGDVIGLRAALTALLADPERCRNMGDAGSARIRKEFSLEAYCQRMEEIIQ